MALNPIEGWYIWHVELAEREYTLGRSSFNIVARTYDEAVAHALYVDFRGGDGYTYVVSVKRIVDDMWFPPSFPLADGVEEETDAELDRLLHGSQLPAWSREA